MTRSEGEAILKEIKRARTALNRVARLEKYSLIDHPGRLLTFQFLLGIMRGIGAFVGATIVVAIAAYILSRFPFAQNFIQSLTVL